MTRPEFEPFVPRCARRPGNGAATVDERAIVADQACAGDVAPADEASPSCAAAAEDETAAQAESPGLDAPDAHVHDAAACAQALRETAIRLASHACARALRVAIARNPLFVARFVDDALGALRAKSGACARLHPEDAAACSHLVQCQVIADASLSPGEVIVEGDGSRIHATTDGRAEILVRAIADG
jgi:hypothetical protein